MSNLNLKIQAAALVLIFGAAVGGKYALNDPSKAVTVLENQGYSEIEINESPILFSCGKDFFGNAFKATNPAGNKIVSGYVCRGLLLKGSTIRFD